METIYEQLKERNAGLAAIIENCKTAAAPILDRIVVRFPTYTNHNLKHSESIISNCEHFIGDTISLSTDELFILLSACILHDIGMAVNDNQLEKYCAQCQTEYFSSLANEKKCDIIRNHHHTFSQYYIMDEWDAFDIPDARYAKVISIVARGHRKSDLLDNIFNDGFVKAGTERVRVSLLSAILRMADEFDITADRTPELYCKYFFPKNKISEEEFKKHLATSMIRYGDEGDSISTIIYKSDEINGYNSLKSMFDKIKEQLEYCQNMLNRRSLPALKIRHIHTYNECVEFNPISIKFNVDNERIFKTLIGNNLYNDKFIAVRECIQNSIDACRYKKMLDMNYNPEITVELTDNLLTITDNGIGMDRNVIEKYFAIIGKSFYIHDTSSNENFKSIGKFGIGIASYFLICNSFRLITCQNGIVYDFDISDNYDEYFHLNQNINATSDGTVVSFILHQSAAEELTSKYLIKSITSTFRFCDVPIIFIGENDKTILSSEALNKDSIYKTFYDCFLPYYSERAESFKISDVTFEDDHIQAACGFVFKYNGTPVDVLSLPMEKDMRRWFRDVNDGYKKINLYHKGVYIKTIPNTGKFSNIVGDINIKQGIELKLDRNDLGINTQLEPLLKELNSQLAGVLLSIIECWPKTIVALQFLELIYMLYISSGKSSDIEHLLYFAKMDKEGETIEFLDYNTVSMLDEWDIVTLKSLGNSKNTDLFGEDLLVCHIDQTISFYIQYFLSLKYGITVFNDGLLRFIRFYKSKDNCVKRYENDYVVPFYASSVLYTNIDRTMLWNLNNPLVAWAVENAVDLKDKEDISNITMKTIFNTYFNLNHIFKEERQNYQFSLTEFNTMLSQLNEKYSVNFVATRDWFALEMQRHIID